MSIPLSELPQTFVDAILLTRNLGFEYLWIDSLCIIQDDNGDWIRESARMAEIYQGAILTISADGAWNSHEGLFYAVNKRSFASPLAIHFPGMAEGSKLSARLTTLEIAGNRVHAITSNKENPLRRRAWALQEWLLSPRIVYFATGELLWECRTHQKCECQIVSQLSGKFDGNQFKRAQSNVDYLHHNSRDGNQQGLFYWNDVVSEFSMRNLTVATDTLPALSGLAEVMNALTGVDYIGGLWKDSLPEALLWDVDRTKRDDDRRFGDGDESGDIGTRRHDCYYAPSWSWASITGGRISFFHCGHPSSSIYLAEVLEVSGKPVNAANPFGPLLSGFIKVKGLLGTIPCNNEWRGLQWDLESTVEGYWIWGNLVLDVTKPASEIASKDEVTVMIIRTYEDCDRTGLCGLALKSTKEKYCYRRVGLVWLLSYGQHFESRDGAPDSDTWSSRILKAREQTIKIV